MPASLRIDSAVRISNLCLWFCLATVLVATSGSVQAAAPVEVENIRIGFGPDNAYKVGAWTPVWVQLRGGDERFTGFMDLIVQDDDGIPTASRQPVDVGPRQSQRFTGYVRPGGRESDVTVRLVDAQGRRVLELPQGRTLPTTPRAIMPDEMLILTLGQPMGVDVIPTLPGFTQASQNSTTDAEVVVIRLDAQGDLIPGRWYGFDSAHAIVIDTADREALQAMDGLRGQAIVDWVKRGGHLILSIGANWQAVKDSVLGPILPAIPRGEERVPSLEAIDSFASSVKSITPPGTDPMMVTRLENPESRGGKVLSIMGTLPLVVRGAQGFGRVTLIALDVNQKLFGDWSDRGLFWSRALDLRHARPDDSKNGSAMGGSGQFYQSGVTDLSSQLRIGLEQFPNVKLIPFGWVAFFIFLYILLIGPGDYLFLKRVLKRMELTWITFPTIVIAVSLLAYFAAYRLKGNDLLVNKVDVVDVDQTAGLIRGRSLVSLFSPQNRDYGIGFLPLLPDLDRDAPPLAEPSASGEPPRPSAGTELVTSWFSIPESQFGAMAGPNRRFNFAGYGYSYQPTSGYERLDNVRIPIWSTKTITGRWFGPAGQPLVTSDLRPVGTDRLSGTVTNSQRFPLKDALLAFGKQVYLLGTMAPGATIRVELSSFRNLAGHLKDSVPKYFSEQPGSRNLKISRPDLLLAVMFHDSESTRLSTRALGNSTLHDLDLTGQLALDRPMLVAQVDRPGAQLVLENVPSPPKVDQTTMLRVILPLHHN